MDSSPPPRFLKLMVEKCPFSENSLRDMGTSLSMMYLRDMHCSSKTVRILTVVIFILWLLSDGCLNCSDFMNSFDLRHSYLPSIRDCCVTNWHSALYFSELVYLKALLTLLHPVSAEGIMFMSGCLSYGLMVGILAYFLNKLMKKDIRYIVLFPCWIVAMYLFRNIYADHDFGSLEFSFLVCAILIFSMAVLSFRVRRGRWFIVCVMFVLFVHLVELRKNSLLLLPLIIYSVSYVVLPSLTVFRRVLISLSTFGLVCSFVGLLLPAVLKPQKLHPSIPMMLSDMKIAATLKNESEAERSYIREHYRVDYNHLASGNLRPCSWFVGDRYGESVSRYWKEIRTRYMDWWIRCPREMMMARVVCAVQLYGEWTTPEWLIKVLQYQYPHLTDSHFGHASKENCEPIRFYRWRFWLWIVSTASLLLFCLRCRRYGYTCMDRVLVLLYVLAALYAASFLVVTPAALHRYVMPSRFVLVMITPVLLMQSYLKGKRQPAQSVLPDTENHRSV